MLSSRRRVIEIEHSAYRNHNGGQLQVGRDGNLFVSTGDGAAPATPSAAGRTETACSGRPLRIDPRRPTSTRGYSVPSGNPFVGRFGRDEIWHYGLRNPWRFPFDRANGNMVVGDVGQGTMEEVDFVSRTRRGANFGWNCFEGTLRYSAGCSAPGHRPPVLQYTIQAKATPAARSWGATSSGDRAIGRLYGKHVYGDYCTGSLHAAVLRETGAPRATRPGPDGPP